MTDCRARWLSVGGLLMVCVLAWGAYPAEAAWSRPQVLHKTVFLEDGVALAASGNTLHAVYYGEDPSLEQKSIIYYRRSRDCGTTWSREQHVAVNEFHGELGFAAVGDVLHLAWADRTVRDRRKRSKPRVFYASSRDAGRTWSEPRLLSPPSFYAEAPSLAASGEEVYVAYRLGGKGPKQRFENPRIDLAVSTDGGESWTRRKATSRVTANGPRIALAESPPGLASRLHLVWSAHDPQRYAPRHQASEDRGATWSKQLFLDQGGPETSASLVDGLATFGGDVHTVWRKVPEEPFAIEVVYDNNVGGGFHPEGRKVSLDLNADPVARAASLAVENSNVYIAWSEDGPLSTVLLSVRSGDRGRTWSRPKLLAKSRVVGDTALATTPDGAGACRSAQHLLYRRQLGSGPGSTTLFYRRRPAKLK